MPAPMLAAASRRQPVPKLAAIRGRSPLAGIVDAGPREGRAGLQSKSLDRRRLHAGVAELAVLAALAAAVPLPTGNARAFHSKAPTAGDLHRTGSLADVVALAQAHGWSVNLGYLCKVLSPATAGDSCLLRPIAIHAKTARRDDHGFNIIPAGEPLPSPILLYHVTPLAGGFFLASADGKLITAASRGRGTGFKPMLGELGSSAFNAELAFWKANFAEIERDVLTGNPSAIPFSEQRR